jgi:hypothetical protein
VARSGRRPPPPITTRRPKPWGLIALTVVVVVFAGLVIGYAVVKINKSNQNSPEAKAEDAKAIPGIVLKDFPSRNHVQGVVKLHRQPAVRRRPRPDLGRLQRHRVPVRAPQGERGAHAGARRGLDHVQAGAWPPTRSTR